MMALQEHSLYDDRSMYNKSSTESSMYLDLKRHKPHVLNTPDVSVFALSTPDVHNLLSSTTTGTSVTSVLTAAGSHHHSPSALLAGSRFHPHHPAVSMEQEFYARGFLERLETLQANDIHQHHSNKNSLHNNYTSSYPATALGSNPSLEAVAPTYVTATLDHIPNFAATATQTTSESTSSFPVSSGQHHDIYYTAESYPLSYHPRTHHDTMIPPYPTTAMLTSGIAQPTMYSVMDTTGHTDVLKEMTMVPDLHTQEQMKVERKKARNRIAASKCRTRRLQRESDLEGKVRILKDSNRELNDEVCSLKDQIMNLKRALSQHSKTGCQIGTSSLSPIQH